MSLNCFRFPAITSDLWGNRLSITDPDAGLITSTYTKYNELETQTDARGNITSYGYDNLGRVTQKKYNAQSATPLTYNYIYDNATGKGKGKLAQINKNSAEEESFAYDDKGRLSQHKKIIDGASYTHKYSYNANGQLDKLTYPDDFAVTYSYSSSGRLSEIRQSNNNLIYRVHARNKFQMPTQCEYGNKLITNYTYNKTGQITAIKTDNNSAIITPGGGSVGKGDDSYEIFTDITVLDYTYTYDNKGLMDSRSEGVVNRLERFAYDNLDRLTETRAGTGAPQTLSYYNDGSISQNSEAGHIYYYNGLQPHAVMKIEQYTQNISNNLCAVEYNYFNQPTKISEGDYRFELSYGSNQQRNMVKRYNNNVLENTMHYVSKYYERSPAPAPVGTRRYHYIYGDNGIVALQIANETAKTDSMYYIHTDHLGSYCAITNKNMDIVQSNRFDPWGNPVGAANFKYTASGFTGHEHYPEFKIINMNGRLYDPVIGRFFSPDKYVANSSFTQDFNRYTYARNNPLMYTDPDGELVWFAPLIAIGVSAAISAASYTIQVACSPGGFQNFKGINLFASTFLGAWSAGATAGIGGLMGGVNLATGSGVLKEFGRAGAHAMVSGLTYMASGSKFWQGAATGAISSFSGSVFNDFPIAEQIALSTVTGGITSQICGGEFWKGAVAGFAISAFNHTLEATIDAVIDSKIRKYVDAMFPGRIAEGTKVKFGLWDNPEEGRTGIYSWNNKKITTEIPENYWYNRSRDNRMLIDCIDHELVHIADYASGRAYQYYSKYGMSAMLNIMDYKAYSQNQWYNQHFRPNNPTTDYSGTINTLRSQLPPGWWNIK